MHQNKVAVKGQPPTLSPSDSSKYTEPQRRKEGEAISDLSECNCALKRHKRVIFKFLWLWKGPQCLLRHYSENYSQVSLKHCKKPTKIFTAQINPMPVLSRKQYFEDDIIKEKDQKDWKFIPLKISTFLFSSRCPNDFRLSASTKTHAIDWNHYYVDKPLTAFPCMSWTSVPFHQGYLLRTPDPCQSPFSSGPISLLPWNLARRGTSTVTLL